jgi:hypothetical protein
VFAQPASAVVAPPFQIFLASSFLSRALLHATKNQQADFALYFLFFSFIHPASQ